MDIDNTNDSDFEYNENDLNDTLIDNDIRIDDDFNNCF